jgi:hypothetical protein
MREIAALLEAFGQGLQLIGAIAVSLGSFLVSLARAFG